MTNSQELIESLATYFGVETKDVIQSTCNPNLFVVEGNGEYLVYETQDDAERAAIEQMEHVIESDGISFVNWDYISADISEFVDNNWFDKAKREFYEDYVEDIRNEWETDDKTRLEAEMEDAGCVDEDEFVDYLCNDWSDSIEWFKFSAGDSEFYEVVRNHPEIVDINKLAEYIVKTDGVSNTLASYDGEEIDLGNCYAYRVN